MNRNVSDRRTRRLHFRSPVLALALGLAVAGPAARADWPPPNPGIRTFFVTQPDTTPQGFDVLACPLLPNGQPGTMLAEDWVCRGPSPVTDIHIWGSWLSNLVDHGATFYVGIWSDQPASNGVPSHPDQLLWWQEYQPGDYLLKLWRQGVVEQFLDPNIPAILGQDTQIWQYNFQLKHPFYQQGTPEHPVIYWTSVMAKTQLNRRFGWKTTRDRFNDAAVYAPALPGAIPQNLAPWQVVRTPASNRLELALALTSGQSWAINKTFYNLTPYVVYHARVRLPGWWPLSDHYDGPPADPWTFVPEWDIATNTVLTWTMPSVGLPYGECVHVGYAGAGLFPPLLNWGWWNPLGQVWLGDVVQFNLAWPRPLPLTPYLIGITNILPPPPPPTVPYQNFIHLDELTIEYYTNVLPLASLNDTVIRSPIAAVPVPIPPVLATILPGANAQLPVPAPPPQATYAVVVAQTSPLDPLGQAQTNVASRDWIMLPTTLPTEDPPASPPVLTTPGRSPDEITVTWQSEPGVLYRVLRCTGYDEPIAWDEVDGRVVASGVLTSKTIPLAGSAAAGFRVEALAP